MQAPESYVIDVCVVCGAQAVYPFRCGHRTETEPWTAPIVVKPSRSARRAVQAAIDCTANEQANIRLREDGNS